MDTPTYLRVKSQIPLVLAAAAHLDWTMAAHMEGPQSSPSDVSRAEDGLDQAILDYIRARKGITS